MVVALSGASGELRQGYFVAAVLGSWSFTGDRTSGTITAQVRSSDPFRLEQPGLSIVVPFGDRGRVRWPVRGVQIAGGSLTAQVGERG
jgi:hypothetical protein